MARRTRIDSADLELPVAAPSGPAEAQQSSAPTSEPPANVAPEKGGDVLECPAHLLGAMPRGCTLQCEVGGLTFWVTTWRADYDRLRQVANAVFTGTELTAMAVAATQDRAHPLLMAEWVCRKLSEPGWKLTTAEAIGAIQQLERIEPWTIGRVFTRLGVRVHEVRIEE